MPSFISSLVQWLRRPQFSVRTFLIVVTLICGLSAFVGSTKYRAYVYRDSISRLGARGVEVRQLRTDNGETRWKQFVQNWIETDAYAGAVVETTMRQQDLTDADVQLLGVFDEIRAVELASPQLTDATLLQLPKLGAIGSLSIREGSYTIEGLKAIGSLQGLNALDLTGVTIDSVGLSALEPALTEHELAIVLDNCPPEQLRRVFEGRKYDRFYLENAALRAFLKQSPRTYGRGSNLFPPMTLTADSLPESGIITLKGMQLDDETLTQLSERKALKQLALWECHFDAAVALKRFRSPSASESSSNATSPMIRMQGEVTANGELGPEELAKLLNHPHIMVLTIEKLQSPELGLPTFLRMGKMNTLNLPPEIPTADLIRLYTSKLRPISVNIARTKAEHEAAIVQFPKGDPFNLKYVDLYQFLSLQGVDIIELDRKRKEKENESSLGP